MVKMIKGRSIKELIEYLPLVSNKAAKFLHKSLKTVVADAGHNYNLALEKLRLKEIRVDEGVSLKRWRAVSRGRAHKYKKSRSHLTIVVEEVK